MELFGFRIVRISEDERRKAYVRELSKKVSEIEKKSNAYAFSKDIYVALLETLEGIIRSYPFFENSDRKLLEFAEVYHQSKLNETITPEILLDIVKKSCRDSFGKTENPWKSTRKS